MWVQPEGHTVLQGGAGERCSEAGAAQWPVLLGLGAGSSGHRGGGGVAGERGCWGGPDSTLSPGLLPHSCKAGACWQGHPGELWRELDFLVLGGPHQLSVLFGSHDPRSRPSGQSVPRKLGPRLVPPPLPWHGLAPCSPGTPALA